MSFSNQDGRLTAKPTSGPNQGQVFEFQSGTKVAFDPDAKYEQAPGRRQRPIYFITKAAKPKLSIDMSSADEWRKFWQFCTGTGQPPARGLAATFSHVFTRPGVRTMSWRYLQCPIPAPGYEAGDSGVTQKVDLMMLDAHLDGVSVFQDAA
jgi:hypothetical protein